MTNPEAVESELNGGTDEDSRLNLAPEAEDDVDLSGTQGDSHREDDGDSPIASLTADSDDDEPEAIGDPKAELEHLKSELERERKRRSDTFGEYQRLNQELSRYKRYDDVPLDEAVETWKKGKAEAQKNIWEPEHPEHGRFERTLQNYDLFEAQMRKAQSDEQRQVVSDMWSESFSQKDLTDLQAWRQHQQEWGRRLAASPQQTMRDLIREESQRLLREEMTYRSEQQRYRDYFQQADIRPIIEEHRDDFIRLVRDRGYLPEDAVELLQARRASRHTVQKQAEVDKREASARERERLARGNATVDRDVQTSKKVDVVTEAMRIANEKGISADLSNRDFLRILHSLEEENLE